jgi:hypothetical protein
MELKICSFWWFVVVELCESEREEREGLEEICRGAVVWNFMRGWGKKSWKI